MFFGKIVALVVVQLDFSGVLKNTACASLFQTLQSDPITGLVSCPISYHIYTKIGTIRLH